MTKDPLRAFRVDDSLWKAALAAARAGNRSLSQVIREALTSFAEGSTTLLREQHGPPLVSMPVAAPGGQDAKVLPLSEDGELVAKAQGVLMARHACNREQAMSFLRHLASARSTSVQVMAAELVAHALGHDGTGGREAEAADPTASGPDGGPGAIVRDHT